jgi:hypothetical protein
MNAKRNALKGRKRRDVHVENYDIYHANTVQPVGLPQSIPLAIPTCWTAEEALVVFELVDDLRDRIWSIYQIKLHDLIYQQRQPPQRDSIQINDDDLPF